MLSFEFGVTLAVRNVTLCRVLRILTNNSNEAVFIKPLFAETKDEETVSSGKN
jgi:hypothetical protein